MSEIVDLLDSGDDARVEKPLSEELLGSGEGTAERQLPDGRWVMVRIKKTRMREWVLMSTDVSRMKRREEALSRLNAVQSSVFSVLDQAIFVFNKDLLLVTANSRCEAVLGFTAEQVTPGRTLLDLYGELRGTGEETPETMQQRIAQFRDGTIPDREEIKRPSGAVIDIRRARLPDGGYTISMNDVSEDHRIRDRLAHMANHDPLTALPNRRFFDDTLSKLPSDQAGSYTIAFLNLIGFKESNETFGHAIGDQILITIAERLRSLLRPNDMAFRLGGDEFVLLVRSASSQDSAKRLGWTLNVLMAEPMELGALSVEIHPAIGLAIGPDHGETPHDVMLNAERAMIAARSGPGLRVFDAELGSAAQRRSTIRADLPSAVDANAFTVLYQPKYDLQTNKIMGMEALVRWTHPDLGPIGPGEFIPLAEKSGVIIALGERILEQATRFAKSLDDQGLGRFQIAVNVSPAQLLGQKMINTVRRVLALSGLEPHMLELEITEGILLQDDGRVPAALKALRSHGIRIAIDDFGTGYSSLGYINQWP
ncbi:MAG: putative bifunctional diguanylate cyclase/phosphodiesterase, partial [Rhodospirillaceae bacterium]